MFNDSTASRALESKLRAIFAPPDMSDSITWHETHQKEIPYSPLRGPWRVQNAPWSRQPLLAAADPEVRQVTVCAAVQMAKSQFIELALNEIIVRNPGPTLALQDQDPNAEDWLKTRLIPLWENCAPVAALYPQDEKKRSKTDVRFPAMQLWVRGARNIRNLQRRSCKTVIGDEVWLYPPGHIRELKARVSAFKKMGKIILAGQGGFEGDDWSKEWEESSREEWGYHCPACGMPQEWHRDRLEFRGAQRSDGEWDFGALARNTHMRCANPSCSHVIPDSEASRFAMNESGLYLRTNHESRPGHVGYRWNKLAGHEWAGIAEDIIRARRAAESGDDKPRRQLAQKTFAQFWSDAPDDEAHAPVTGGYRSGDAWEDEAWVINGKVVSPAQLSALAYANGAPISKDEFDARVRFRGMTVDVQRGSFFFVVRAWSADGKSRKVAHGEVRTWEQLDKIAAQNEVHSTMCWADCGDADDDFWVEMRRRRWRALRGDRRDDYTWTITRKDSRTGGVKRATFIKPYSQPTRFGNSYLHAVPVHYWSNLVFKDRLDRQRRNGMNTVPDDTDPDYHAQMESEFKQRDKKSGKRTWVQRGNRANHLWDCEAMQYILPFALGVFKYEASKGPNDPEREDAKGEPGDAAPDEVAD